MSRPWRPGGVSIEGVDASAYKIPTDAPEADGTIAWDATTLVLVEARGGGQTGLGYSYADTATAKLIQDMLAEVVKGGDALAPQASWAKLTARVRNVGRGGIAAMAISAVDVALWDLKARLLDIPLASLLGPLRPAAPIYGSGGFTSYSIRQLQEQLAGWVHAGIPRVKMKVGTDPAADPKRVRSAREAIGQAELFVDANGAYGRKQALALAERFVNESGVSWFEEPVIADDLEGHHFLRGRVPASMEIATGEYGYELRDFERIARARAVDVLQADATRCGGITGFLRVAALCEAHDLPLSSHCAPTLHVPLGCAAPHFRHIEYFHDHDRIEHMLFDGAPVPEAGALKPDLARPGLGIDFKRADAERFRVA